MLDDMGESFRDIVNGLGKTKVGIRVRWLRGGIGRRESIVDSNHSRAGEFGSEGFRNAVITCKGTARGNKLRSAKKVDQDRWCSNTLDVSRVIDAGGRVSFVSSKEIGTVYSSFTLPLPPTRTSRLCVAKVW